jgi:hypothetical protein
MMTSVEDLDLIWNIKSNTLVASTTEFANKKGDSDRILFFQMK